MVGDQGQGMQCLRRGTPWGEDWEVWVETEMSVVSRVSDIGNTWIGVGCSIVKVSDSVGIQV